MSETVILSRGKVTPMEISSPGVPEKNASVEISSPGIPEKNAPELADLKAKLNEASRLVEDIVLKKYLCSLADLEVLPLGDDAKRISDIRLFKITEMVYQKDEYSTYKFASVFSSVQNLNCGVFIVLDSDGEKTDFYMGIRSLDDKRTTKSLKDTLKNALVGQFPGAKCVDLLDKEAEKFLEGISDKNIASVSCVANNKDEDFKDNATFIQGLEKLALAMQGQKYTAVVLAKSTPSDQLDEIRRAYEMIYTQLSPFANMQLSYGTNTAISISDSISHGTTTGTSYTKSTGITKGTNHSQGTATNESVSRTDMKGMLVKVLGEAALGVASIATAPLTGGASLAAAGVIMAGNVTLGAYQPKMINKGHAENENFGEHEDYNENEAFGEHEDRNVGNAHEEGRTTGESETMQLTMQNKTLLNTLDRIDLHLKRLTECESLGMWECAAYFLSDSQETAEMAAGTYKALMKGTSSGVETSAINYWGRKNKEKLLLLKEYITNFIHPVFAYDSERGPLRVTAASLLSSNELAILMGLPRKSVCGFPVVEHADFGKEVVSYRKTAGRKNLSLGKVFSMGTETKTPVKLDMDSLAMHTFVTGATGSGKSNTVYWLLNQLHTVYDIPFMVVEPAKGEYKKVFGKLHNVSVYGTNGKKCQLLKLNPFSFPEDVHVLEHLDRLVEIFNVCWPMYAAMPAILKEGMERAYVAAGWDLEQSENKDGRKFPNFADTLKQIEAVIGESKYSADSKGDYSGALLTRVRSLTTGLNRLIFCSDEISDGNLFDKSVIVDLSRVGSMETRSLIMGLLVMKLNEYRMSSDKVNSALSHITVLEEAHNLLRRTSTEQTSEGANLLGKSVEMLANSIAEMRTYGEGFIIADQSPGLLDLSVIRNTNTKIILRLPDYDDRKLVGYAAGLDDEQIDELSKLRQGVAAVYQNDWVEPVLVQVEKCNLAETGYDYSSEPSVRKGELREQLVNFLIRGRVREELDFSVSDIKQGLKSLELSSDNQEFVEKQIAEYQENKSLALWNDENVQELSRRITDILGVKARVENLIISAQSYKDLTVWLKEVVLQLSPEASEQKITVLSKCFIRDMSISEDGDKVRKGIYLKWQNYMKEGGVR